MRRDRTHRPIGQSALAALFIPVVVWCNWNDTPTGIDLNSLPQFHLLRIRSGVLKNGGRSSFDGISAVAALDHVRLRGRSKSGKAWEAQMCPFCLDEVWRADLDGNGTQDYVFFSGGPYFNGRTTPLFSLSVLLMDGQGLPVPFFTVVYHGENGEGIKHFVRLGNTGRPELLISTYDENISDPLVGPFCSGHWVTQLYHFSEFAAQEIRGVVAGVSFPFVHEWSYRGTECEAYDKPSFPVTPATVYDHATGPKGELTAAPKSPHGSGIWFSIAPIAGCTAIRPEAIVYDRAGLCEIGFPNLMSTYNEDLEKTIWSDGARITLRGVNKSTSGGECSVNLMWATK
jgi:hypothetical protein